MDKTSETLAHALETITDLAADNTVTMPGLTQSTWDSYRLNKITELGAKALATLPETTDTQKFRKLAQDTAEAQEWHETGQEPTWIDALATPDDWAKKLAEETEDKNCLICGGSGGMFNVTCISCDGTGLEN